MRNFFWSAVAFLVLRVVLFPLAIVGCWIGERKDELREWLFIRTAKKIAGKLKSRGIAVKHFGYAWNSCKVVAEVGPEQVANFRSVYAWAVRRFGWRYTPSQICKEAEPLQYLDKAWAQSIGIEEYGAEKWSVPCRTCGKRKLWGIWWGDDASHQEPWIGYHKTDCRLISRTVKTVEGLCDKCIRDLVATAG